MNLNQHPSPRSGNPNSGQEVVDRARRGNGEAKTGSLFAACRCYLAKRVVKLYGLEKAQPKLRKAS
jgi:hypothetical protein